MCVCVCVSVCECKVDLVLNNSQGLISHKNQPTDQLTNNYSCK